ncbi:hypothetical protein Tco_1267991, partial [Tanacetum coccineum]
MSTYLKNMAGYEYNQLKNKSFGDIQKLFDKAMKRLNTFVDMDKELVEDSKVRAEGSETRAEGSSKRVGDELEQESTKKQKMDDEKEITKLQILIEVVPDKKEVAIDAIPLATKPPCIIDYKIHKEEKKTYYQIIRADGSSKIFLSSSQNNSRINEVFGSILLVIDEALNETRDFEEEYQEVIENGNAPPITKVVECVKTTIVPITVKEKAQRR